MTKIKVGSIWVAADGGHYGYIVIGPMRENGEIPVRGFTSLGLADYTRTIDSFKITYRYRQIFP